MRIHLLAESSPNPVLTAVMEELAREHEVAVHDTRTLPAGYGRGPGLQEPPDVVLLKSRTPQARRVARTAERAGSLVVNPPAATTTALDRAATADALDRAGVPAPRSWSVPALRDLGADGAALPWPLVVKSRTSSRRDLVRLVTGRAELDELLAEWGDEPVVAQEFAANDGFDIKVWVIGSDLSAARRRSALEPIDKSADQHLDPADLPADWTRTARDAGAALGLQLYGVDLLITGGHPVVVDVNPFPGFRGARGPAESLLRFLSPIMAPGMVAA
ncbi:ATP-grasp domain-containing protein [Geodermatophilus sabuli]|uniref:Ribosomal protein S6--L-glutamate ligase n=1 Tax=Geodermatophilus sabuli TaxID=1564158 RepID=A0A285EHR1_9ACTN|nr:alpha-L-glutamate ligase [Geodermatophilus sabuli]MBB3086232.1 ribosomal protein S6--L-glutamate ligase [Geodermatophilus sabuli]SNX97551.1 ribosomal protein S6--L-glutamate ligase [Geodermatophilus sabuli]